MDNGKRIKIPVLMRALGAVLVMAACNREFESPYTPGSSGYAGDEWTEDDDGDGVADSLEKYAPDCELPAAQCLENAKVIGRISTVRNALSARDMMLWMDEPAQAPSLVWTPSEGAARGFVLSSSDSSKVRPSDGKLQPMSTGNAQITVTVPGADTLSATFIAKVVSGGKKVEAVSSRDMIISVGSDTVPALAWTPPDATYRDYSLQSDKPDVVRIVGQSLRGMDTGKARITLESMDGGRKTAFSVTVLEGTARIYADSLRAESMYLVMGAESQAPVLNWLPENTSDTRYKLLLLTNTRVVTLSEDKTRLIPGEPGTVKVFALAQDGSGKTAEFPVTVVSEVVSVQSIEASDMELVANAASEPPILEWKPTSASNRKYFLSSSEPGVALPQNGKIRPLSIGVSEFIVTTEDGGFRDTFMVNVGLPDSSIHVDSVTVSALSIPVGGADAKPIITWHPANPGNRGYTLTSDNPDVAVPVGESVRPIKEGKADFHLLTTDGDRAGDFTVTVFPVDFPVESIEADTLYLTAGTEGAPKLTWKPEKATDKNYTLVSADPAIASITGGTLVRGVSVGSAKVTVYAPDSLGKSSVFTVMVNAKFIPVTDVSADNLSMNLGDAPKSPVVSFSPHTATDKSVILAASPGQSIFRVDSGNKVEALHPGKAVLSIFLKADSKIAATCTVTVTALVNNLSARDTTLRLGGGDFNPTVLFTWEPSDASSRIYSLKSLDSTTVSTVSGGLALRPLAGGSARIIVRALDGSGKADTFMVAVTVPVLGVSAKNVAMKTTDSTLNPWSLFTWNPTGATDRNFTLKYLAATAPTNIVTIVNQYQLKAVGPGTASIVVVSADNAAAKDTFVVTVTRPVNSITVEPMTMKKSEADREPAVVFLPSDASNKGFSLVSLKTSVATVVSGKLIHPVAAGTASIVVTSTDGAKQDTFTVTVTIPITGIDAENLTMSVGDPDKAPTVTTLPADATDKRYTLEESGNSVEIVNNKIHAVQLGTTTVMIRSVENTEIVGSFTVTVEWDFGVGPGDGPGGGP